MKTIQEYCDELDWSISELSRQAGLSWQAASKAYYGEPVQPRTKRDICRALSEGFGTEVKTHQVNWEPGAK